MAEVHPVELVAAEDEGVIEIVVEEMEEVFANGVGGALIPGSIGKGLFGGEDFDETAGEMVELIALGNVAMEGGGVELGEEVNAFEAGVDAVRNGDIDEAIFAGERDSGFGSFTGEWE
jgi:hypothetical protein